MSDQLTFFHFNDVYHISDIDLISRFAYICRSTKASGTTALAVFSGDAFSPSLESAVLKGDHMVPVLNHLKIDVACYGNHDFDFGEARLTQLSRETNFPWLLSNARRSSPNVDPNDDGFEGQLLAGANEFVIKFMGGYRIGFFGLGGTDWPSNCQHLPPSRILSPVAVSRRLAKYLRTVEKCDFVIGITHMRLVEDLAVSRATLCGDERVDLILGGHDHQVVCRLAGDFNENPDVILQGRQNEDIVSQGQVMNINGTVRIVKSGTDWKGYSIVNLLVTRDQNGKAYLETVKLHQYTDLMSHPLYTGLPADPELSLIISEIQGRITSEVQHPLLSTLVPLEGRSSILRRQETNLGNLLADAVRAFYHADIAFVNSGGVRCDRIVQPALNAGGVMSVKDMIDIVPFDNAFVVKRVQGRALLAALENSISNAHTDGRFLQVSGLRLVASWRKPEGKRLVEAFYVPRSEREQKILVEKRYMIAMSSFIASGFDGYVCLKDAEALIGDEAAVTDTSLMLDIFRDPVLKRGSSNERSEVMEVMEMEEKVELGQGIDRAREAVIVGHDDGYDVPLISPVIDGRIRFVDGLGDDQGN